MSDAKPAEWEVRTPIGQAVILRALYQRVQLQIHGSAANGVPYSCAVTLDVNEALLIMEALAEAIEAASTPSERVSP